MNKEIRSNIDKEQLSKVLDSVYKKCKNEVWFSDFRLYLEVLRYDSCRGENGKVGEYLRDLNLANKERDVWKEKYMKLYKEKEDNIANRYYDKLELDRKYFENSLNQCKKDFDNKLTREKEEFNQELDKLEKVNQKWKAMYTSKCEIIDKLLRKLEGD